MLAFEFDEVTKRYGQRLALARVRLQASRGICLGLLGPNGAGKTTALRLLLGFASPSQGSVRLLGSDPRQARARAGVGYLPERLVLPRRMSVRRFAHLHGRLAGLSGRDLASQVEAVLERCGLGDRVRERVDALSKGLAQRAGFAQALLGNPSLLLLDEPTSGLDPLGVREARDWILEARRHGASVLVSSHRLSEMERTCDEVVILNEGRVAAAGTLDEIVRPGEDLEDAFVRAVRA